MHLYFTNFSTIIGSLEQSWHYFILGIIQGLTEFIPISSTAHLKVIPILLGWEDPGVSITACLQLGSIIALLGYFRRDFILILRSFLNFNLIDSSKYANSKFTLVIFIGTIPIILVGIFIKLFWEGYETSFIRSIPFIAVISIIMSLMLLLVEIYGSRKKKLNQISISDGAFIGLAQVFALIPGVSRSGVTITAALMKGWQRKSAAKFSFILGIPVISIAGLVELRDAFILNKEVISIDLIIGIISSALTSWLAIDFLMRFLQKNSMMIFVTYRFLFGVLLLFWYY